MKNIGRDSITNMPETDIFDSIFNISYFQDISSSCREIIHMAELLEKKKNIEILERLKEKPAMYSEVYSPNDELEIFAGLFEDAIKNNKKIHII